MPSGREEGKIPILDLKCWLDEEGIIRFEHYEKLMASKLLLSANSALPKKQKRNIHINECVRRLQNCSPDLSWGEKRVFLQEYVVRLYHAGYSELFRQNVVKQSIAQYEGMLVADKDGRHHLYRERDWEELERRDKKNKKKVNWYTRGGYDTVIKVNPTPGGELAKQMQQVVDRNKGPVKVKIQEQFGIKMKNKLGLSWAKLSTRLAN